jgi:hypothetical protein
MRWVAVPLALALLAGCGPRSDQDRLDAATAEQARTERSGQLVLDELEPRITAWRALPAAEREERGRGFGAELEQALTRVDGTSAQNKVLLWLADWRMHYQHGEGVGPCLDRLEASRFMKLKSSGRRLRIEWLLRTGDVAQARVRATALTREIPEWSWLMNLVQVHELVGQAPPRTAGKNLGGGPDDPAAGRTEPWLVYVFADVLNDDTQFLLGQWLAEAARPEYDGKARVVCVTSEGAPLAALTKTRDLAGAQLLDLLWASPVSGGDAEQWHTAWKLAPRLTTAAILGPGPRRLVLAISDDPVDLRAVIGKR